MHASIHWSRRGAVDTRDTESDTESDSSDEEAPYCPFPTAPRRESADAFLGRVRAHLRAHRRLLARTNCPPSGSDSSSEEEDASDDDPAAWCGRPSTASLVETSSEVWATSAGGWSSSNEPERLLAGSGHAGPSAAQRLLERSATIGCYGQGLHRSTPLTRAVSCPDLAQAPGPSTARPATARPLSLNGKVSGCPWQTTSSSRRRKRLERRRQKKADGGSSRKKVQGARRLPALDGDRKKRPSTASLLLRVYK